MALAARSAPGLARTRFDAVLLALRGCGVRRGICGLLRCGDVDAALRGAGPWRRLERNERGAGRRDRHERTLRRLEGQERECRLRERRAALAGRNDPAHGLAECHETRRRTVVQAKRAGTREIAGTQRVAPCGVDHGRNGAHAVPRLGGKPGRPSRCPVRRSARTCVELGTREAGSLSAPRGSPTCSLHAPGGRPACSLHAPRGSPTCSLCAARRRPACGLRAFRASKGEDAPALCAGPGSGAYGLRGSPSGSVHGSPA
jgi:hypothetical protein